MLVDTQGLVMRAKVHAASAFNRDGLKPLMELVGERFPRLSHLWLVLIAGGFRLNRSGKFRSDRGG